MTQVLPERNNNSGGDTLLENTFARLSDKVPEFTQKSYDPNFIGPLDAFDDGRMLLMRQVEDVAQIAMKDVIVFPKYHADLVTKVTNEMARGHLRLSSDYPQLDAHDQTSQFIEDNFRQVVVNPDEVRNDIIAKNIAAIRLMQEATLKQNSSIEKLKRDGIETQLTILRLRQALIESNITEDQKAVFDKIADISSISPSEITDEEYTKSPTGKFWNIVRQLSLWTFETMGIVAPK